MQNSQYTQRSEPPDMFRNPQENLDYQSFHPPDFAEPAAPLWHQPRRTREPEYANYMSPQSRYPPQRDFPQPPYAQMVPPSSSSPWQGGQQPGIRERYAAQSPKWGQFGDPMNADRAQMHASPYPPKFESRERAARAGQQVINAPVRGEFAVHESPLRRSGQYVVHRTNYEERHPESLRPSLSQPSLARVGKAQEKVDMGAMDKRGYTAPQQAYPFQPQYANPYGPADSLAMMMNDNGPSYKPHFPANTQYCGSHAYVHRGAPGENSSESHDSAAQLDPQERKAMEALSLLIPGTPAYERQLQHVMKLSELRFQRELLHEQRELERERHLAEQEKAQWEREKYQQQLKADLERQYNQQRVNYIADTQHPMLSKNAPPLDEERHPCFANGYENFMPMDGPGITSPEQGWINRQADDHRSPMTPQNSQRLRSQRNSSGVNSKERQAANRKEGSDQYDAPASVSGDGYSDYHGSEIRSVHSSDDDIRNRADNDAASTASKQSSSKEVNQKKDAPIDALEQYKGDNAFISTPPRAPDEVYLRPGDGFDVYIDSARFLPDSCTISKVVIRALTQDFSPIGKTVECACTLDAPIKCPLYSAYAAFRSQYDSEKEDSSEIPPFDATMTLIARIDAIDRNSYQPEVAGYALLNLFCSPEATTNQEQPTYEDNTWEGVTLNSGAFQVPLFQGPPNKKHPLKASSMHETLARVPCATILVRIVPVFREQNNLVESGIRGNSAGDTVISSRSAGKAQYGSPEVSHEDQLLAPTRKSVPRDEWERVGLFVEPPSYSSGVYDSSRCRPSVAELALYPKRCSNGMLTVRQFLQEQYQLAVQRLAEQARNNRTTRKSDSMLPKICKEDRFIDRVNILCPATPRPEMTNAPEQVEEGTFGVPPPPDTDDEVIGRWIKMRLRGHPTKMIDYRFAVPFDPREGIQVSVDGIQNVNKRSGLLVVFHCIAPMCPLYSRDGDMKNIGMTIFRKWGSNQKHQAFEESFVTHSNLPLTSKLAVIFDVRSVTFSKKPKRGQNESNTTRTPLQADNIQPFLNEVYKLGNGNFLDWSLLDQYEFNVESYGWTILPVLDIQARGYVQRGAFRLPLFKGKPSSEILSNLKKGRETSQDSEIPYPLEVVEKALSSTEPDLKLEYVDSGGSLLVRLNDSQFNGIVRIGQALYKETYTLNEKIKSQIRAPLEQFHQGKSLRKKFLPKGSDERIFDQTLDWKVVDTIIEEMQSRKKGGGPTEYSTKESPDAPITSKRGGSKKKFS